MNSTKPNLWILGIFYRNPSDHRLLVPKRIWFLGWTLNFGHKASWLILLAIAGLIVYFSLATGN